MVCLVVAGLVFLAAPLTVRDYHALAQRSDHYEISDGDLADMAEWLNHRDLSDTTVYVASIHYRHPTLAFLAPGYETFKWLTGGRTVVAPPPNDGTDRPALLLVPRSTDYRWAEAYLPDPGGAEADIPNGPDGEPAFELYLLDAGTLLAVGHETRVDFSHVIQLEGYDVLDSSAGAVDVALLWRVLNLPPSDDYHVFAHLVDAWGLTWGESLPFQYPSAQWTPGERFLDRITVPLPAGAPPGEYVLQVGLYSPDKDANLTVVGEDGGFAGTVASLSVTVPKSVPQAAGDDMAQSYRTPVGTELAPGLWLLGANLDTVEARTRAPLFLTLFWRADSPLDAYQVRLRAGEQVLYQGAPVHGAYPTSQWPAGAQVIDRYNPRVPLETLAGEWPLVVEVVAPDGQVRSATLGTLTVVAPARSYDVPEMQHELGLSLGESVELLGYDWVKAGEDGAAKLTLYWRALSEIEFDFTLYVHLLAADGALVDQVDSMPHDGSYPMSLWAKGEVVKETLQLRAPANALRPLSVRVGMYRLTTGEQPGKPLLIELDR